MKNRNIYSLLIGVGDYQELNTENLPTYYADVKLLENALVEGLKIPVENIRLMIGEEKPGFVKVADFAKVIAGFNQLLQKEDTFILYFTGHGANKALVFSDGQIELQSVIDYIEKLPVKNKIVFLDSCYAGNFGTSGARKLQLEQSVAEFAGHGIAVMASCAAYEVSRIGEDGKYSVFTSALSMGLAKNHRKKKGMISLDDINDEVRELVHFWNELHPTKVQHHIFRSSMGGTIYFQIEEYQAYKQQEIAWETEEYAVVNVKPLSSSNMKRLCAFVVIKGEMNQWKLPGYTKEIAKVIKRARVYSTEKSEAKFGDTEARAVWCYFGCDTSDIVNHLHYAYTIWVADREAKTLYFKPNRYAIECDGIYVYENPSYSMLKKMQQPVLSREEFVKENKKLLSEIVSMAEQFIFDLQEVANGTLNIVVMQERYKGWIKTVKQLYINSSEMDIAPDDLHDWAVEILNLAGWVLDLSILLENKAGGGNIGDREVWLIKHAITHYNESLEKLKVLEVRVKE